uniref:Uncharacterized protein n=1 Tax=Anguilla anguilla TaxID=7936 RepID=A0A0E9VY18_ANGAN
MTLIQQNTALIHTPSMDWNAMLPNIENTKDRIDALTFSSEKMEESFFVSKNIKNRWLLHSIGKSLKMTSRSTHPQY